jgi:hypothetical protein
MQLGVRDLLAQRESVLKQREAETTARVRAVVAATSRTDGAGGAGEAREALMTDGRRVGCWEAVVRRLVGRPLRQAVSASDPSGSPVSTLREKVGELQTRADAYRTQARAAMAAGKRADAVTLLKRCKLLERQSVSTGAAVSALEEQHIQIESAAITASITRAINKNVSKVKKRHRGLLGQVDKAADGSSELNDLSQEVNDSLGSFATGGGLDDDDLLEELNAMVGEGDDEEGSGLEAVGGAVAHGHADSAPPTWPAAPKRDVVAARCAAGDGVAGQVAAV